MKTIVRNEKKGIEVLSSEQLKKVRGGDGEPMVWIFR